MDLREIMGSIGTVIDAAGVFAILIGAVIASTRFIRRSYTHAIPLQAFRQDLGRAILLGLEFLIAGDIIRTVGMSPTMQNVLVLAIIVLIRTFLSTSLQLELEGRWPWQPPAQPNVPEA